MAEYQVDSLKHLASLIQKHSEKHQRRLERELRRAAKRGVTAVKQNVPVAFGELRESVHSEPVDGGAQIIVDAPHAAAVNNGARPHWMPLEPLIRWVKLRGMQALLTDRQRGRLPGGTTRAAASAIGRMLAGKTMSAGDLGNPEGGSGEFSASYVPVSAVSQIDAAEQVARMIQRAIAKRGTKPHHYAEKSLPEIEGYVDLAVKNAFADND